jgi:hypothetical protein
MAWRVRALLSVAGLLAHGACASSPPPAPDPALGPVMAWACDGGAAFSAQWTAGGNFEVLAGGRMYWLPAKKVSSGLRFADRKVEFSERGGYAKLSGAEGGPYANCTL